MLDIDSLMADLRGLAEGEIAAAIEALVRNGTDFAVNRINPLAFAARHGLDPEAGLSAFLHATRLGLFEMNWNVVCSGCGGVLHMATSLKAVDQERYHCALCVMQCEPILDEMVEITFTLDPRVRPISAHEPEALPLWDYVRQIFWSSGADLPPDLEPLMGEAVWNAADLSAGDSLAWSLDLPPGAALAFDPVSHASVLIAISGPPVSQAQEMTLSFGHHPGFTQTAGLAPGPVRLVVENRGTRRALPILWQLSQHLHDLVGRRVPILTARRLLSHQTFRDLYRADVLDVDQRFKITSLTFLFTDLKGSTQLYEQVGDLAAFDLVRAHFRSLTDVVARAGGAVVKTIGDAVMATFPTPIAGMAAALHMHEAMAALNERRGRPDLLLKIGLHAGPCLAVALNDRQDYFGQTVNIAARVQALALAGKVFATASILNEGEVLHLVQARGHALSHASRVLRGIENEVTVYEIG